MTNHLTSRIRILPYRQGSKSAKALSLELGGKVLKLEGSKFKPKPGDLIINWGSTIEDYNFGQAGWMNDPTDIRNVSNKKIFFQANEGEEWLPPFWTEKENIPNEEFPIVCRTVLAGHSGDGIVIADSMDDIVPAPLYTKYLKKKDEYRVHVGRKGETSIIISVQRKARRIGFDNPNWQIRNHANGFVFVRNEVNPPNSVLEVAQQALMRSGLEFGAVDVIWNEHAQKAWVLEINTAPGLEGQTVTDYGNYFKEIING